MHITVAGIVQSKANVVCEISGILLGKYLSTN